MVARVFIVVIGEYMIEFGGCEGITKVFVPEF